MKVPQEGKGPGCSKHGWSNYRVIKGEFKPAMGGGGGSTHDTFKCVTCEQDLQNIFPEESS